MFWKGEQSLLLILIHTSLERKNSLNHERELIVLSCYMCRGFVEEGREC